MKSKQKVNQIIRLAQKDLLSKNCNMFAAQSVNNEVLIFSVSVVLDVDNSGDRDDLSLKYIFIEEKKHLSGINNSFNEVSTKSGFSY